LFVASITHHNVNMPAGSLETKVFKQGRAQITYKWKGAVSHKTRMILPQ